MYVNTCFTNHRKRLRDFTMEVFRKGTFKTNIFSQLSASFQVRRLQIPSNQEEEISSNIGGYCNLISCIFSLSKQEEVEKVDSFYQMNFSWKQQFDKTNCLKVLTLVIIGTLSAVTSWPRQAERTPIVFLKIFFHTNLNFILFLSMIHTIKIWHHIWCGWPINLVSNFKTMYQR